MNKLKLEVGKSYRTRDGREAVIACYKGIKYKYPYSGSVDSVYGYSWNENGKNNEFRPVHSDLIAEWQDEPAPSILQEAENLINGDRAESYGDAKENFENIAKGWSVLFGKEVTARQVGLAMAWLKICRENNNHKRDNLVDLAGYAALIERL